MAINPDRDPIDEEIQRERYPKEPAVLTLADEHREAQAAIGTS